MFRILATAILFCGAFGSPLVLPTRDGKIVGGTPVNIADFPYQVSLQSYGSHICGGSIILPKYILTAAHCTNGVLVPVVSISIRAGSSTREMGGSVHAVLRIIQHPQWDSGTNDIDISIVELLLTFFMGANVQPVLVATSGSTIDPGENVWVSGWGALISGGSFPNQLQAVEVQIIDQATCRLAFADSSDSSFITDNMICASVNGGGKGFCEGNNNVFMFFLISLEFFL